MFSERDQNDLQNATSPSSVASITCWPKNNFTNKNNNNKNNNNNNYNNKNNNNNDYLLTQ